MPVSSRTTRVPSLALSLDALHALTTSTLELNPEAAWRVGTRYSAAATFTLAPWDATFPNGGDAIPAAVATRDRNCVAKHGNSRI